MVLYSVVVPQTLRHMRGMTDKPGKSKGKRKPAASKGPTKAELKYKVRGEQQSGCNTGLTLPVSLY